jgi:hypothetical protein
MNYTKPEVAALGKAVSLIEHVTTPKPQFQIFDTLYLSVAPAYDLDE